MDRRIQTQGSLDKSHSFTLFDNIINDIHENQLEKDLMSFKQSTKIYQDIVAKGKQKIDQQFHERKKLITAQKRIHRSSLINKSQMLKAQLRHKMCEQIFNTVLHKIKERISQDQQQHCILLIKLIVEGALRMFEPQLHIRCIPCHLQTVEKVIQASQQTFSSIMKQETGRNYSIKLKISNNDVLKQRNITLKQDHKQFTKKRQDQQCIGGVLLSDPSGNITYKNTIDARINILKEISLPMMRAFLWPHQNQQKQNEH